MRHLRQGCPAHARYHPHVHRGRVLARSIAADAICGDRNVLYDQTLSRSSGIAMLHNQYLRHLSHAVIRGSADAVLEALRRNF